MNLFYSLLMLENDFVAESVNIETLDDEAEGMPIVRKNNTIKAQSHTIK